MLQDLFHLLDANGGDTASQDELVKAGQCFAITEERSSKQKIKKGRKKQVLVLTFLHCFLKERQIYDNVGVSAFAEMDEDEDGEITQEEFIKVTVKDRV